MQELSWLIHPLLLSAKTLAITFVLLLFLGLGAAYFLAFYRGRFKSLLEAVVMFPLIFPPIATGFLLLYILGRNGALGKALNLQIVFSFSALVIASFLAGLPLFVKPVQSALESLPKSLIEAGQSLGNSRLALALFILTPIVSKSVVSALVLALARGLGEVGITLMLGGNIVGKTDTVSLAIYNAVYDGENERALILSLILVVLSIFMFGFINFLDRKRAS